MKKIIALVATLACMNVMAADNMAAADTANTDCVCEDADLFEGLFAELALGYANGEIKDFPKSNDLSKKDKVKLGRFAALLGAGYRYNMGNGWYVGGTANIVFSSKKKNVTFDASAATATVKALAGHFMKTDGLTAANYTVAGKVKVKQATVSPELALSLGKSFSNYLIEVLAGGIYTGAKITAEDLTATTGGTSTPIKGNVKVKKFVPFVGLKGTYAINQNVSVGATVKYAFNVKKNNIAIKKNLSVLLGVAYRF